MIFFRCLVWIVLGWAIVPSMTALSLTVSEQYPVISGYLGPLNPLKAALPFLIGFLLVNRSCFQSRAVLVIIGILGILLFSSVLTAVPCGFSPSVFREVMIIVTGIVGALCFLLAPLKIQKRIVAFWLAFIFLGCFLDWFFPALIEWLQKFIFDPGSLEVYARELVVQEVGKNTLGGVFGRQSLAKLLVWIPFLALSLFGRKSWMSWVSLAVAFFLILSTTQRAAVIAVAFGFTFVFLGYLIHLPRAQIIGFCSAGLLALVIGLVVFINSSALPDRILNVIGSSENSNVSYGARANAMSRLRMLQFSVKKIKENPRGSACISDDEFYRNRIFPSHAHHMFLQEFRQFGWPWGLIHLMVWVLALVRASSSSSSPSVFLAAGIISIFVTGYFDHTWTVLNHSVVLSVILLMAFRKEIIHSDAPVAY